jgi:uncharacterized protein YggE
MKDLKFPFFTILFIFLGLFIYTKLSGPIPFFINSLQTTKENLFQVEGQGKATAVPDTATINLGVTQKSLTVEEAQDKVNTVTDKLIKDIKKLGVEEKYIKTANYSVNPEYDYTKGSGTITGYSVTQQLEIKVKPISKVNKVTDTATAAGANIVSNVSFTFSDELKAQLEDTARKEAVTIAKRKAQSLAGAAGLRLGKIIDVVESQSPNQYLRSSIPAVGGILKDSSTPETKITPGENTVEVNVVLSYETY